MDSHLFIHTGLKEGGRTRKGRKKERGELRREKDREGERGKKKGCRDGGGGWQEILREKGEKS